MSGPPRQADRVEQLGRPLPASIAPRARQRERELDVLRRGQRPEQTEVLEHETHRGAPERRHLIAVERVEVVTADVDLAALRALEAA